MNEQEKQKLREEGFDSCRFYGDSLIQLRNMRFSMDQIYDKRKEFSGADLNFLIEDSMDCLEFCTVAMNLIEDHYQNYFLKDLWGIYRKNDRKTELKDFAESHKRLAEYVAYSKIKSLAGVENA